LGKHARKIGKKRIHPHGEANSAFASLSPGGWDAHAQNTKTMTMGGRPLWAEPSVQSLGGGVCGGLGGFTQPYKFDLGDRERRIIGACIPAGEIIRL